jgi:DNA modification methylase
MAKIDITKTELVWPGKYNEDGTRKEVPRVNLPFQVIETVNESRATREVQKVTSLGLFDTYEGKEGNTFEAGWRNKLIWGDNLLVMGALLQKFAGKIDLIYIDPPFATGADFSFTAPIGDADAELLKEPSILEEKAYRDTWGPHGERYPDWICQRLILCKDLLAPHGSLFVHLDPTIVHAVKVILDEIFGHSSEKSDEPGFRNEIAWCYSGGGIPKREFPRKHDVILWFTKTAEWTFNTQYRPYSEGTVQRGRTAVKGDNATLRQEGTPVNDWWPDIKRITSPTDFEKLYYDTQKSEELLERIVRTASNPGDLVADFFCGSGTTLATAEKLGRRWIGCDLGRWGVHVTRKRLLGIEECKPFEVLNLGRYERQYWQGVTFGDSKTKPLGERALYEYLAFILKLYGAQPVTGLMHIHGKKNKGLVHIGAVDAPVTITEIDAAVDECAKLKQTELHVLGWEWEMGLAGPNNEVRKPGPVQDLAKKKNVRLLLLQIPREVMEMQAAAKGDVRFFELAFLEAEIKHPKKLTAQVALKDFVIPNTELIPEEVRSKVKKWSDYIDYWAVDWDFRNDTFMQGWVAYRTRKERKLPLASDHCCAN